MSSFLQEELGVAMSGVKWDVANFKLWQSTRPDVILFSPKQPQLAMGSNGRYQAAVSQFRQQADDTYKITGGSAIFTVTSAIQYDPKAFEEVKQSWINEMNAVGPAPPVNPRFIPLNTQKGKATVLINGMSGVADEAHNDQDIGTPGGTNSFLIELTALGAQEWVQGIKEKKGIPAGLKMTYEYLRMMPDCGAVVKVHGERAFTTFSTQLKASYDGLWYGGSVDIAAAWEKMVRDGTVEITFIGQLPPELEAIRTDLVTTFANQAREQMFNSLFAPKPDVKPAEAGDSGGFFGGANFALKYTKAEEVTDLEQTIRFQGWTWLTASMDAEITSLLHELDESYVTEVNTEMSFPASIVVDSDPMLENVAVSWSSSEGKSPEAPVYGAEGGNSTYTVTSAKPDDVEIGYTAKVNFVPPTWPVVTSTDRKTVKDGGNAAIIKASSWIGRHMVYMFIREGNEIRMPDGDDEYLVLNVSYTGPHLSRAIKASARITPFEPVEFCYPLAPDGRRGEAKFSAFGVIGGKLMRSPGEQPISFDEDAVFILADTDTIQLVSKDAVLTEDDKLAARLIAGGGRPVVSGNGTGPASESGKKPTNGTGNGYGNGSLSGTVVGVEYGLNGPSLVLELAGGKTRRVPLRTPELADAFDDRRKRVRVKLDDQQRASQITVEL